MKRLLNQFLSTVQLALRRTWTALGSHVAVALGVLVATTTICALLLYAEAVSVAVRATGWPAPMRTRSMIS